MASPNYTKVSQSTVDELRKNGMAANLKKAKSGEASAEFVEAVRRFYPSAFKDVKDAKITASKKESFSSNKSDETVKANLSKKVERNKKSASKKSSSNVGINRPGYITHVSGSPSKPSKAAVTSKHKDLSMAARRRLSGTTTNDNPNDLNGDGKVSTGEWIKNRHQIGKRNFKDIREGAKKDLSKAVGFMKKNSAPISGTKKGY